MTLLKRIKMSQLIALPDLEPMTVREALDKGLVELQTRYFISENVNYQTILKDKWETDYDIYHVKVCPILGVTVAQTEAELKEWAVAFYEGDTENKQWKIVSRNYVAETETNSFFGWVSSFVKDSQHV
jgi:hypothetical protein